MDQSQQLTQLIERALENGWKYPYSLDQLEAHHIVTWIDRYKSDLEGYSLNDLLFGDNLSFLKAVNKGIQNGGYYAQQLALKPDNERIPWLYKQVFGTE